MNQVINTNSVISGGARVRLDNGTWYGGSHVELRSRSLGGGRTVSSFHCHHSHFQFLGDLFIGLGCMPSFDRLVIVFREIKGCNATICMPMTLVELKYSITVYCNAIE